MAQDIVAALGARLEAHLRSQEARIKTVEETVRTQVLSQPPVLFALPERSTLFPKDRTRTKGDDLPLAPTPPTPNGFDIGATFRRKGVLSDVPMAVTRVENGMVYASFTDSEGSHEMAFDPNQLDLVESPLESAVQATVSAHATASVVGTAIAFTPAPVPVVSSATDSTTASAPIAISTDTVAASIARAMAPVASTVAESIARAMAPAVASAPVLAAADTPPQPIANTAANVNVAVAATTVASASPASNANATAAVAAASVASVSANTTASITLPDGTQQFGFAPTGGTYNDRPKAYTPAVAPSFGEGATFRRKGVLAEPPMTVTRTGDGLIFANYTDSDGTREMAFFPNQLDLVTAAP